MSRNLKATITSKRFQAKFYKGHWRKHLQEFWHFDDLDRTVFQWFYLGGIIVGFL